MYRPIRTFLAAGAAFLGAATAPAWAADSLPCADYISTSLGDDPDVGFLVGSETRTETIDYSIKAEPGGMGSTVTVVKTTTWEVGTYVMSDGTLIEIDCRDYSLA